MYCTNCGEKNNDNAKFCFNCGAKLELHNETEETPENKLTLERRQHNTAKDETTPKKEKKKSRKKYIIASVIIILLLFIFGSSPDDSDSTSATTDATKEETVSQNETIDLSFLNLYTNAEWTITEDGDVTRYINRQMYYDPTEEIIDFTKELEENSDMTFTVERDPDQTRVFTIHEDGNIGIITEFIEEVSTVSVVVEFENKRNVVIGELTLKEENPEKGKTDFDIPLLSNPSLDWNNSSNGHINTYSVSTKINLIDEVKNHIETVSEEYDLIFCKKEIETVENGIVYSAACYGETPDELICITVTHQPVADNYYICYALGENYKIDSETDIDNTTNSSDYETPAFNTTAEQTTQTTTQSTTLTTTTAATTEAQTTVHTSSDKIQLPDIEAFLHYKVARNEDMMQDDANGNPNIHYISYRVSSGNGNGAVTEYIELLKSGKYDIEFDYEEKGSGYYSYPYLYAFSHNGDKDIIQSHNDLNDKYHDFSIFVNRGSDVLIAFYYDINSFEFIDDGERSTITEFSDLSGKPLPNNNDSGFEPTSRAYHTCTDCDGDGDCTVCNGKGYVYAIATRTDEDKLCDKCRGTGDCVRCGGTGKRG